MAQKSKSNKKVAGERRKANSDPNILSYRHSDRRKNNPEVGMVKPENDPARPKSVWHYDPHLDPVLQFDPARAKIEKLIESALKSREESKMRGALEELKRLQQPYLTWTGKAEGTSFEVDAVSLHVHERIDPASILSSVRKRAKEGKKPGNFLQPDLYAAPFENLPLRDAIDFYRHERGWANRLIAGDALLVMNSLIQRESMAGQVQMIYIDPPYGISYGSNFQPFTNRKPNLRTDREEDLTQEPETIKAFRDTWELGIHSYLTYLRDRLILCKDLLHETGSLFIQISDENHHLIRDLAGEVFDVKNVVVSIPVKKKGSQKGGLLEPVNDYLVWIAKDKSKIKYRQLFVKRETDEEITDDFSNVELPNGIVTSLARLEKTDHMEAGSYRTNLALLSKNHPGSKIFKADPSTGGNPGRSQARVYKFRGIEFDPGIARGLGWKAAAETDYGLSGMDRLAATGRLHIGSKQLAVRRYPDDFGLKAISNWWDGFGGASDPIYVVQTNEKIIERCLLMTTDPGDLVFDPTCGSGTTAYAAEKWGRRWVTCDTSRVAITLTKQRLLTQGYDYYTLRYPHEGLKGGFANRTIPHITAAGVANNPEVDDIYARMHPAIDSSLQALNVALKSYSPLDKFEVADGQRKGELLDFSAKAGLLEWEVPFEFPEAWPDATRQAFNAFHAARQGMQKQMDFSIAAHAEQETLFDQPHIDRAKLRVSGPFTVEAVPFPSVLALEQAQQPVQADFAIARSGESSRQHQWRDELMKTGIRGKGGQMLRIGELETLPSARYLHASGTLADTGERVVVSFGPEHAALEQRQVALALNEAETLRPAPKFIIFCSFTFDPEAAKDIDETKWPGVLLLKAQMNTDLLTEDLKKARSNNQSFWLMGQPDVEVRKRKDGMYEVEVNGFDYFDTTRGELISGGKGKIAVWLLDTDYDERSLFPRQVFFPMAGKDDGWMKLKKDIRAELNESLLTQFHGTVSLPFEPGDNRKVAVKIVDDRGIESLKIVALD